MYLGGLLLKEGETRGKEGKSEGRGDTIQYDTRCYFNVRSKADISQLNLPHGTGERDFVFCPRKKKKSRRVCGRKRNLLGADGNHASAAQLHARRRTGYDTVNTDTVTRA